MINIKCTIFENLKNAFYKLRFLGKNNTAFFKKILFLIVLDDMYDWSACLDEHQSVQKRLQELRTRYLMCNRELEICSNPNDYYVNVNTPQSNYTWKRVWDDRSTEFITDNIEGFPFIHLTNITVTKKMNNEKYLYVETLPISDNGEVNIFETAIDNNNYITE